MMKRNKCSQLISKNRMQFLHFVRLDGSIECITMRILLIILLLSSVLTVRSQSPAKLPDSYPRIMGIDLPRQKDEQQGESITTNHCLTDHVMEKAKSDFQFIEFRENYFNQRIAEQNILRNRELDLFIPVVVHIIHNEGLENINNESVIQGIEDLNNAFANSNVYFEEDGVQIHIQFCLAQQDPDGLPTSGITRTVSSFTDLLVESDDLAMKNLVRWNPYEYLNIWLVKEIVSASSGSGVAGYAFLPSAHGEDIDGIVVEARWFGSSPDNSKIHIHEVGHYLGLYHTFQSGCENDNCMQDGDKVCDTPPDNSLYPVSCNSSPNSCSSDEDDPSLNNPFRSIALGGLGEQPDLFQNYMDYGLNECQVLFTPGQGIRMYDALTIQRSSLLESNGCISSCGIALHGITPSANAFVVGESVSIASSITATTEVEYVWTFNGQSISTESSVNYTFTGMDQSGYFKLVVLNPLQGCSVSDSVYITVSCNSDVSFTFSPEFPEINETVFFTNNNPELIAFQWYLDDELTSEAAGFSQLYSLPENHSVHLIGYNGTCYDTSQVKYFSVGSCYDGSNNNWLFGADDGMQINFNSGSPMVTSLAATSDLIRTDEGIATISDRNGNLLFHANTSQIYNRNYQSFYDSLSIGSSTAQGVMIIPDPAGGNEYYVFCTQEQGGFSEWSQEGFSYLKVDMDLNNGLGGVVGDSIRLLPRVIEAQTSIRHCNGSDVWVVCHGFGNKIFYSFLITDEGVSSPVISSVGATIPSYESANAIGILKISPQGNILAKSATVLQRLELFRFDNSTGQVLDDFSQFNEELDLGTSVDPYGLEFSLDGSKLYLTGKYGDPNIYQFDLSSGIASEMLNSFQSIGTAQTALALGNIARGADGKIYVTHNHSVFPFTQNENIDVIQYPNNAGLACSFIEDGLITTRKTQQGIQNILPPIYESNKPEISGPTMICTNVMNALYTTSCGNNSWELHGQNTLIVLSESQVHVNFYLPGTDTLICHRQTDCFGLLSDTLLIHVVTASLNITGPTNVCHTAGLVTYSAGSGEFEWNHSGDNQFIIVSQTIVRINFTTIGTDTIFCRKLNTCAQLLRDTLIIHSGPYPLFLGNDTTVCSGASIALDPIGNFTSYLWSNGSTGQTLFPTEPGEYWLHTTGPGVCSSTDTIYIGFSQGSFQAPDLDTVQVCITASGYYDITVPPTNYEHRWLTSNGSMLPSISYYCDAAFDYWKVPIYFLSEEGCMDLDSLIVTRRTPLNEFELGSTLLLCPGETISMNIDSLNHPGCVFSWQDNSVGYQTLIDTTGYYYAIRHDTLCDTYDFDAIDVGTIDLNSLSLDDSLLLCENTTIMLDAGDYYADLMWEDGSSDQTRFISDPGIYHVTAYTACGNVYDTTDVVLVDPSEYQLHLPDSILICESDLPFSIVESNSNFDVLIWDDGSVGQTYEAQDSGEFFITGNYYCGQEIDSCLLVIIPAPYSQLHDSVFACRAALPVSMSPSGDQAITYLWSSGATTSSNNLNVEGWHFLTSTFTCTERYDSVFLSLYPDPFISLPLDTTLCHGENIELNAPQEYSNFWSTGEETPSIMVFQEDTIILQSINQYSCQAADTIVVSYSPLYLSIPNEVWFCENDSIEIVAETNAEQLLWNNGSDETSTFYDQPGAYSLTAVLDQCSLLSYGSMITLPLPVFNLGNDTTLLIGNPLTIFGPMTMDEYAWNVAGETGPSLLVTASGLYALTVADEFGCEYSDTIFVDFITGLDYAMNGFFIEVPNMISRSDNQLIAKSNNVIVENVQIYDVLGKLVSNTNNFPVIWEGITSGIELPTSTIYYHISYQTIDGQFGVKSGRVLIID